MKAQVGDWLIVASPTLNNHRKKGRIVEVRHADGSPPYMVQWLNSDHATFVFPGPDAHLEHKAHDLLPTK